MKKVDLALAKMAMESRGIVLEDVTDKVERIDKVRSEFALKPGKKAPLASVSPITDKKKPTGVDWNKKKIVSGKEKMSKDEIAQNIADMLIDSAKLKIVDTESAFYKELGFEFNKHFFVMYGGTETDRFSLSNYKTIRDYLDVFREEADWVFCRSQGTEYIYTFEQYRYYHLTQKLLFTALSVGGNALARKRISRASLGSKAIDRRLDASIGAVMKDKLNSYALLSIIDSALYPKATLEYHEWYDHKTFQTEVDKDGKADNKIILDGVKRGIDILLDVDINKLCNDTINQEQLTYVAT